jgi:hypothetical protein
LQHSSRNKNKVPCIRHDPTHHSEASYLSENEAKSRTGGFFYMGSNTKTGKKLTNGAILIISKVLKQVMSSAAEAEIGEIFINAKEGAVLRTTLE